MKFAQAWMQHKEGIGLGGSMDSKIGASVAGTAILFDVI